VAPGRGSRDGAAGEARPGPGHVTGSRQPHLRAHTFEVRPSAAPSFGRSGTSPPTRLACSNLGRAHPHSESTDLQAGSPGRFSRSVLQAGGRLADCASFYYPRGYVSRRYLPHLPSSDLVRMWGPCRAGPRARAAGGALPVQGDTAPRQVGPPPRVVLLLPVGLSPGRAVALRRVSLEGSPLGPFLAVSDRRSPFRDLRVRTPSPRAAVCRRSPSGWPPPSIGASPICRNGTWPASRSRRPPRGAERPLSGRPYQA